METLKETLNIIEKILDDYQDKEKQELFLNLEELPEEDFVFFKQMLDDNLISKDYFPMKYKDYQTWKALQKYNMLK